MPEHMKVGRVVRIRVNPKDCMSVADAIVKLGMKDHIPQMTFDQACRIALSSSLEGLRQAGVLPERDGFEFTELMRSFKTDPRNMKGKLAFTQLIDQAETIRAIVPSKERERRRIKYEEMRMHFDADPVNHPKPQPGTKEYEEWEQLVSEFLE